MKYSSDKPITEVSQDRYSRKEYAKKLAKLLYEKNLSDDFVVGVYSRWGYGKSSTLTMVKEYVGDKAVVISFNPWVFESRDAIITGLLFKLAQAIDFAMRENSESGVAAKEHFTKIKKKVTRNGALGGGDTVINLIKDYTSLVGVGLAVATGSPLASSGANLASNLLQKFIKTSSVEDIKARIEAKIEQTGKRVIIMIDDLDRLDKEEIFQLLKIVKIIADFKGVTYLIAFDEEAVVKAINQRFSSSGQKEAGRSFLEKIIQVPLHLPVIARDTLSDELLNGIDTILKDNKVDISDEEVSDFRYVYDREILPLVDSPRMVTRYLNSLKFTLPFVSKEVNMADFLVIESLRLFHPVEYENIRHEKQLLTGSERNFSFRDDEDDKEFKDRIHSLSGGNGSVLEIIKALFPVVNKKYSQHATSSSLSQLRDQKRVASPDYYDRYFSYGLSKSDFSDTDLIKIITQESADAITSDLLPLFESRDQGLLLSKIKTYWKATPNPLELAKSVIALVGVLEKNAKGAFLDSPVEKSVDILTEIIKTSEDRMGYLRVLLKDPIQPEQLFYLIREVVLESKDDNRERFLEKSDLKEFEGMAVDHIKRLAEGQSLHSNDSRVGHILYQYWAEYGDREEVNQYLKSKIKSANDALDYVTLHLAKWSGGRGSYRGDFDRATYKYIEQVIDMQHLYNLIIADKPDLKGTEEYPDLEHADGGVAKVGNEQSDNFREILSRQIIYLYEHPPVSEGSDTSNEF